VVRDGPKTMVGVDEARHNTGLANNRSRK